MQQVSIREFCGRSGVGPPCWARQHAFEKCCWCVALLACVVCGLLLFLYSRMRCFCFPQYARTQNLKPNKQQFVTSRAAAAFSDILQMWCSQPFFFLRRCSAAAECDYIDCAALNCVLCSSDYDLDDDDEAGGGVLVFACWYVHKRHSKRHVLWCVVEKSIQWTLLFVRKYIYMYIHIYVARHRCNRMQGIVSHRHETEM